MNARVSPRRDPWLLVWRLSTEGRLLAAVLIGMAVYLLSLTLIPQVPSDPLAADRWLAQAQARFGTATGALYRLGLFSLSRSPLPRLLLVLLGGLLLVKAVEQSERLLSIRRSGGPGVGAAIAQTLACVGSLFLLLGLLVNQHWGWRVDGLIGYPGEPVEVPGYGPVSIQAGQPGMAIYVTGNGPALKLRAHDTSNNPLLLRQTPREAARPELRLTLSPDSPEAFFAVSEGGLVGRVSMQERSGLSTDTPLKLQLFRSPTGDQVYQTELTTDHEEIEVEGIRLQADRTSYLLLSASHAPGRWMEGTGVVLAAMGLLGALVWAASTAGRRRGRLWAFAAILALLTLVTAIAAIRNLIGLGKLWDGSAAQTALTVAWAATLAVGLLCRPPRRAAVEQGGEP